MTRTVDITIRVETDVPLEVLRTLSYAETKRPDRHWFEPVENIGPDEDGDLPRRAIGIVSVTAVEMTTCSVCNRVMPNDPGADYHRKQCQAQAIRKQLQEERSKLSPDGAKIQQLLRELELAEYVGD